MEKKVQEELLARVSILQQAGMNEKLCEKIKEGEFVLTGYAIEPHPSFEKCEKMKCAFEKTNNAKVLFGLLDTLYSVQCMSLIYISQYESDWEFDRSILEDCSSVTFTYNFTEGFDETGEISFRFNENGYPVRSA